MSDGRSEFAGEKVRTYSLPSPSPGDAGGLPREMDRDFAKVSLEVARIFLLSGNMFRIVAATIAVRESCNYSYARDQFFSTREKSAIRDHGEGICRRAKWIFPSIVRPTYKIESFYEIKL